MSPFFVSPQSRRVSFANPIQQQETADDIDRRSPAVRTSSPRRSRVGALPQPKVRLQPHTWVRSAAEPL